MMNRNMINDEVLENVTGGTVGEFEELVEACSSNPILSGLGGLAAHVPGANLISAKVMEAALADALNIDARIDLGIGGTGVGSKHNVYIDRSTGRAISHGTVLARIRRAA
jgi:hypothetical protein